MFSHYIIIIIFVSNSNFTKERRIYEHICTYFVYNYICLYIYLYIFLYEKFFSRYQDVQIHRKKNYHDTKKDLRFLVYLQI